MLRVGHVASQSEKRFSWAESNRASAMVADRVAHFIWEALICSCVPALSFFGSICGIDLCRCPLINILSAVGSPQVCETVNASKNSGSVTLGGRRVSVTRPDLGLVHTVGWIDLVEGSAEVVRLRVGGGEDLLSGADLHCRASGMRCARIS